MSTPKRKPTRTMDEKVDELIKIAATVYSHHFITEDVVVTDGGKALFESHLKAASFGYIYAMSYTENAELKDVCLRALQKLFGWDDEYIAINVLGG